MRRYLLLGLIVLVALGGGAFFGWLPGHLDRSMNRVTGSPPFRASAEAEDLHATLFVADLHGDALLWRRDPLERHGRGHIDLPRLAEANAGLQVFSAVTKVPFGLNYEENPSDSDQLVGLTVAQAWPPNTWFSPYGRARHQARRLHRLAERSRTPELLVVETRADLARLRERRGRGEAVVGGLLALEGLHAIEGEPAKLDSLFAAGYRMAGLTHFFDNAVAGSAHGMEKGGLTRLGPDVIRRMETLGMVMDLAHASPAAVDEALELATRPVVVSHGGVKATCPGPRNLSDAQLEGIAATGGVVGIGLWPGAVCDSTVAATARAMRHVADRVGVEHVALGSDFDGAVTAPIDVTGLPLLTEALLAQGFSRDEVARIMGGNVLRVLEAGLPP